ncbi:AlbA family DNA-binding domain-containing protein [Lysobacter capsici]|uniref:AlbA family DNA-binding domain-containing protein n=1 Tax=Lysobacter capsici TaxID=435897 RepID=UPI0016519DF3|nr:ATP-binding protein [Lysobacter capsici]
MDNSPQATNAEVRKRSDLPLYQRAASDIGTADLTGLKELQEGWFIEFKEKVTDPSKLARSISSFANSHGGLLVIGVKEEQKTRRMADFAPMTKEAAEACIIRAREAVTSHVTPPAYYDAHAVEVESLGADDEARWIVFISVPKGKTGPYLHSSGCIYVRVGDASAPCALTDLSQHERLWEESLHRKKRLKDRVEHLSEQFQVGIPSFHVAILADADSPGRSKKCSFEDFRAIALSSHRSSAGAIFDHVQTLDSSFLARRTEKLIEANGLVWDYDYRNGLHFVKIPIATHIWLGGEFDNRPELFGVSSLASRLRKSEAAENVMVLNLLPALFFLSIVIRKVQSMHLLEGYEGDLKLNAKVVDAKGTIPFLGTPMYYSEIDEIGFPYVMREVGFVNKLDNPDAWIKFPVSREKDLMAGLEVDVGAAFAVFSRIAQSIGISRYLSLGMTGSNKSLNGVESLANLFAEAHSTGFSFTSQNNINAEKKRG